MDTGNKEVSTKTEEYGQKRIDKERAKAQRKLDNLNSKIWLDTEKAKYQAQLDKLDLIEAELNKEL